MAITYTWSNAEETKLKYVDDSTTPETVLFIPPVTGNRHYDEYIASGITAGDYVAPVIVDPGPTELELLTARIETLEAKVQTLETDHTTLMNNDNNNNGGY